MGLNLPDTAVPLINQSSSSSILTRRNKIAILVQAALIQLAGLAWLSIANGSIAALGWLPVAYGFMIYFRLFRHSIRRR